MKRGLCQEEGCASNQSCTCTKKRLSNPNPRISTQSRDYDIAFPAFAKPEEVACISLQPNKQVLIANRKNLKFYRPPSLNTNLHFDLDRGFDQWIRDDEPNLLNPLLKLLIHRKEQLERTNQHERKVSIKEAAFGADVVSFRGLYTRVGGTPYETRDGWKIAIIRVDDVFFLCEYETDAKIARNAKATDRDLHMTYWGYQFEQYLVSDTPDGVPDASAPVDNRVQYASIVRTKLGDHRLLFSGEVDCADPSTKKYVELKTSRHFTNPRQEQNFHRFKTLKWWLQSFLIGIETIVCGFRDDSGIVRSTQSYQTADLPKHPAAVWKGAVAMNFCRAVLDMIKSTVRENNPETVYLMEWYPGNAFLTLNRLEDSSSYQFLPDWFFEQFTC